MSRLDIALALAAEGFWVFPLKVNGKTPAHKGWQQEASRDPNQLYEWFASGHINIGIYTEKFGDDEALLVVDCDKKKGKDGYAELLGLELHGYELGNTLTHTTPSGGRHYIFRSAEAVRSSVGRIATGLDIRSGGGFIVGPGSVTKDGEYRSEGGEIVRAPDWLVGRCGERKPLRVRESGVAGTVGNRDAVARRARQYLEADAPLAVEGQAGDQTTYRVACRLKDLGCDPALAFELMLEFWNDRCSPPWDMSDMREKVGNAFRYGNDPTGIATPERDFGHRAVSEPRRDISTDVVPIHSPYEKLNQEFAFVLAGGGAHILRETTDVHGLPTLEHLDEGAFHKRFASQKITYGEKTIPLTKDWMQWDGRRTYDGICFMPGKEAPRQFYNLWRGFAVEPWPDDVPPPAEAQAGLDDFLGHALTNVCGGDQTLFDWLMGYFAHIVQRPWEKPLVALVFKGRKGVGKNALIEHIGRLLGSHFLITSKRRYLVSNFTGHLENLLLFALDEAFWSGDKEAEGTLKDLITGKNHVVEHKGKEPYIVDNRTRIAIIGNESWMVPASYDERRFAVFDVGLGRQRDVAFFRQLQSHMDGGGYRLLLRHLLGLPFDVQGYMDAPKTEGLLDQKHASLDPFGEWLLACLTEGSVLGSDFAGQWPEKIECNRFRDAFGHWARKRGIRSRLPTERELGKSLYDMLPAVTHRRARTDGSLGYVYTLPPLTECRAAWDTFIGHTVAWPKE